MSGLEFDVDAKKLNAALKAVGPDRPVAKAIQIWPRGQGPASITSVNIFTSVKMSARTTKLGYKKHKIASVVYQVLSRILIAS